MEKFITIDKGFWKYFLLCLKDSGKKWLEHFEGWKKVTEPIGVAITTAALTILSQRMVNGMVKMSDWNIAIISIVAAPFVWMSFVYLFKLIFAPYRLFLKQKAELEKYNLDKICFSVIPYSIAGAKGWAIKIENGKDFDLDAVLLEIKQVVVGEKLALYSYKEPNTYILNFIEEFNGLIDKKIVGDYSGRKSGIKKGKCRYFILTKNHQDDTQLPYVFECTPADLNLLDKNLSISEIVDSPPLLEIEFRCEITKENTRWRLPFQNIYVQEISDGSFEKVSNP